MSTLEVPGYQPIHIDRDAAGTWWLYMGDNFVAFSRDQWHQFARMVAAACLEEPAPEESARIVSVSLADAGIDSASVPEGTTASRCTACGETRLSYPGDLTDEWKDHFDYCGDEEPPYLPS